MRAWKGHTGFERTAARPLVIVHLCAQFTSHVPNWIWPPVELDLIAFTVTAGTASRSFRNARVLDWIFCGRRARCGRVAFVSCSCCGWAVGGVGVGGGV